MSPGEPRGAAGARTGLARLARRRVSVAALAFAAAAAALLGEAALSGAPLPLALLGACLALAAWLVRDDRLRARLAAEGGPGVVVVKEGRIGYLGPETGGVVDLDALERVEAARRGGELVWTLVARDGAPLSIPAGAEGAGALLDALAPLPGFDPGALSEAEEGRAAVLFRRDGATRPVALSGGES